MEHAALVSLLLGAAVVGSADVSVHASLL